MAKQKTKEQLAEIKFDRETYGISFMKLATKYNISDVAIIKRSKKEGWGDGRNIESLVREKVAEKVSGIVSGTNFKEKAAAIDAEAGKRAGVIDKHRAEWPTARGMVEDGCRTHEAAKDLSDKRIAFEDLKAAKIVAETLKIIQEGERKAWGLDGYIDVTLLTDEQLEAMSKGRMPV